MNRSSRWRAALAREVAPIYAAKGNVAAVILGGSTARGHADRYSDIELGVFWRRPPTDGERQAAAAAIDGDLHRLYPYLPEEEVWSDDFYLGRARSGEPKSGILLEVVHYTTEFVGRTLDEVLEEHDPALLKQNLMAGVVDAVPLYNAALVADWQARAAAYPDGLRLAVVKRYAQIDHFWREEMWRARGNLTMLYQSFVEAQQKMLHVLLGLNRVYYFGFKWPAVVAERLERKPPDLLPRLQRAYRVVAAEGAREVATLVEEVYDLVGQKLPEIDVGRLRTIFRYRRPQWEQTPPMASGKGDGADGGSRRE